MNALEKKYQEIIAKITALTNLESRSADQVTELSGLLEEGKGLQNELQLLKSGADLTSWGQKLAPGESEKVGEALIAIDPEEKRGPVVKDFSEAESWMGEKKQRAIREPSYYRDWMTGVRMNFANMPDVTYKALQEGRDDYGGYLVPGEISDMIIAREPHPTSILANVTRLSCGSDKLRMPMFRYTTDDIRASGVTTQWTGELQTTAEDTSLQNWGMREIPIHEGTIDIQFSRSMAEDVSFDLANYIVAQGNTAYSLDMDQVIVSNTGNGIAKPRGILLNPGGTDEPPTTNVTDPISGDGVISLWGALPAQYRANAKWLANSSTVWARLAQLKAGSNEYIGLVQSWLSNPLGNARVDMMLGAPIIYSAFMPAAGTANNVLVVGDFAKGYAFVERVGMSAYPYGDGDRAMLTAGLQGVVLRFRVGGAILNSRALRVGVQS